MSAAGSRHMGRVAPKLRESARDEDCLMRLEGVCTFDPARTILSHCCHEAAGKGGAMKAVDLATAYACDRCDAVYDGQAPRPEGMTREHVEISWAFAHYRTLVRFIEKGLI